MEKGQQILLDYFESIAPKRDKWKKRNRFYQKTIEQQFSYIIPEGSTVLMLGIIGEYLGKLFIENKRRPNYLISETNLVE